MGKNLTEMSFRAWGELHGVTESAVRKARDSQPPRLGPHCFGKNASGKRPVIYKELADLDWINNFNPRYERKTKGTKETGPTTNTAALNKSTPGNTKSYNDVKHTQAQIETQRSAIRLKKEQGELVLKTKVYEHLYEFGKEIRLKLQDLPDQIIDNILAASTREEAFDLMAEKIDEILLSLTTINESLDV